MNGWKNENGLEYLSGAFSLWYFRSLIYMHAQNILPEQIFFPLYGDFIAFPSDLHSTERPEELGDALH